MLHISFGNPARPNRASDETITRDTRLREQSVSVFRDVKHLVGKACRPTGQGHRKLSQSCDETFCGTVPGRQPGTGPAFRRWRSAGVGKARVGNTVAPSGRGASPTMPPDARPGRPARSAGRPPARPGSGRGQPVECNGRANEKSPAGPAGHIHPHGRGRSGGARLAEVRIRLSPIRA